MHVTNTPYCSCHSRRIPKSLQRNRGVCIPDITRPSTGFKIIQGCRFDDTVLSQSYRRSLNTKRCKRIIQLIELQICFVTHFRSKGQWEESHDEIAFHHPTAPTAPQQPYRFEQHGARISFDPHSGHRYITFSTARPWIYLIIEQKSSRSKTCWPNLADHCQNKKFAWAMLSPSRI